MCTTTELNLYCEHSNELACAAKAAMQQRLNEGLEESTACSRCWAARTVLRLEDAPLRISYAAAARWKRAGPSVIEKGYKIGISSDFWNRYEEDIALAKGLGAHICVSQNCCPHCAIYLLPVECTVCQGPASATPAITNQF